MTPPGAAGAGRASGPAARLLAMDVCPLCGGALVDIRAKAVCSSCGRICEGCCEGAPECAPPRAPARPAPAGPDDTAAAVRGR